MCQTDTGRRRPPARGCEGRRRQGLEQNACSLAFRVPALAAGSGKGVTIIGLCCQRHERLFSGCFLKTLTVAELSKKTMVQPPGF